MWSSWWWGWGVGDEVSCVHCRHKEDAKSITIPNNWYSILIMGQPRGFFKSTKGVKQGDPFLNRQLYSFWPQNACQG